MSKTKATREDIHNQISEFLENFIDYPREMVKEDTEINEIGLDSLDMIELAMDLELHYSINIDDNEVEEIVTISDLINLTLEKLEVK